MPLASVEEKTSVSDGAQSNRKTTATQNNMPLANRREKITASDAIQSNMRATATQSNRQVRQRNRMTTEQSYTTTSTKQNLTTTSSFAWQIVQALPEHIPPIAQNMRNADKKEVWASHRQTPEEALVFAFEHSPLVWTCLIDDIPSSMFGVCTPEHTESTLGVPWLLSTPRIYRMKQNFLRNSLYYVDAMQRAFPRLENIVHAENTTSIRWLAWCGFTVETSFFTVINKEKFYHFWRIA